MRYGKKWKSYRRLFHEYMGPGPVKGYEDTLRRASNSLLVRLDKDPGHYREHTKLSVVHVVLSIHQRPADVPRSLSDTLALEIAYGLSIDSPDHPILLRADEAMYAVKCGLTPGKWLVDILPCRERMFYFWFRSHPTDPKQSDTSRHGSLARPSANLHRLGGTVWTALSRSLLISSSNACRFGATCSTVKSRPHRLTGGF